MSARAGTQRYSTDAGSFVALRSGTATWIGDGAEGMGVVSAESGALHGRPYSVDSRFNDAAGTNPEELIAAAHASSFTMYLTLLLTEAGFTVDRLDTTALLTLEKDQHGFSISRLHLVLTAWFHWQTTRRFNRLQPKPKQIAPCPGC